MKKQQASVNQHLHLPSVHARGPVHFDYEEDLYFEGDPEQGATFVINFEAEGLGHRRTIGFYSLEQLEDLQLEVLMRDGHPEAKAIMQDRAEFEYNRQVRIATGQERACAICGCSETRACFGGGCIWATECICSKCIQTSEV